MTQSQAPAATLVQWLDVAIAVAFKEFGDRL